jgi:YegS/Rv2252/BmrU family lipid kinase
MVVIVNPATHGNASAIVDLMHRSAPQDVDLDVRFTRSAGTTTTLTRDALEGEARAVVAVGGDGTVAAVAAALQNTNIPLGVIPGGSTNITARQAGIPAEPARAISLLFGSHRHMDHDIGLWGELPFLHMAGAGLDSRLFEDANPATKRRLGWLAYVPPALHDLRDSLTRFTIVADGVSVDLTAITVLVANGSAIISPHISLFPGIETDDGWLDILAFTPETPRQALAVLASAVTHRLASSHFVTHVRAQHIQIMSDPMLPVELDGDVVTQTPVSLAIVPGALRVIVPHL